MLVTLRQSDTNSSSDMVPLALFAFSVTNQTFSMPSDPPKDSGFI